MKAFLGVVSRLAAAAALAGALRGGAVAFPTVNNGDGTFSYAVNVVRQYDETVTAQKSGLASLLSETLGSNTNYYLGMNGTRLYEGSDASLAVVTRTGAPDTSANASVRSVVQLGQPQDLNKITVEWSSTAYYPVNFGVRVSPDNSTWYDARPLGAHPGTQVVSSTFSAPVPVQYIELYQEGTNASNGHFGRINEVQAFAKIPAVTPPTTDMGYNMLWLGTASAANLSGAGTWASFTSVLDPDDRRSLTGWAGSATSSANAVGQIDLGAPYGVYSIGLNFYTGGGARRWEYGGRVETSLDGNAWTTVLNATADLSTTQIAIPLQTMRYIRITDYLDPADNTGVGTGRLGHVEVFTAFIPEPGSLMLVAGTCLLAMRRRATATRRRQDGAPRTALALDRTGNAEE